MLALRIIKELLELISYPIDSDYRPTSYLYKFGRSSGEGVFAKGLKLRSRVKIERLSIEEDYGEIVAKIPSESSEDVYTVKITLPLDFECTCPYHTHHFNPCKHVYATILNLLELEGVLVDDWRVQYIVYEGLNMLAYVKAKSLTAYR